MNPDDEIDFESLLNTFQQKVELFDEMGELYKRGWFLVKTQYDYPWSEEDEEWFRDNIHGDHRCYVNQWVFEKSEDAMLFSLRYHT